MVTKYYDTPIEYLKGVGPQRAETLKKEAEIFTFGDLLHYFPYRYNDKSKIIKISQIENDFTYILLKGKIVDTQVIGKKWQSRFVASLKDETGTIELVWFNGVKWLKDKFSPDMLYIVFGKPTYFNGKYNITHPEIEVFNENENINEFKFSPVYSSTEKLKAKGLDSKGISKLVKTLISDQKSHISETLTEDIIEIVKLIPRNEAFYNIHFPKSALDLEKAQHRLKFEELFLLQLNLLRLKLVRTNNSIGHKFLIVGDKVNDFYSKYLTFTLTNAQKKVIKEIRADLGSGKQMNRLLQGDVGSGKTVVALMSMLIAIDNGFQATFMAPTEILAIQHFNTILKLIGNLDVKVELLTGSTKASKRKIIHESLINGTIDILIGTHALIENIVQFKNLGLVIIDEQHRFGVAQRAKLWDKNTIPPHILVMTATPIPRTLAMTFYGDLNFSVIDELPPGRKSIKTLHKFEHDRLKVFAFLKDQIAKGRQIYVVYPLINESETLDLKHLMEGYDILSNHFPLPEYAISMVHGQMKPKEKEYEMNRFKKGESQIMVATTVIEVGVDVPNASVMVIENADRFGLSQLHQLRGRVGRGAEQSFCILMTDFKLSADARKRLDTMVRTTDGFEISEVDLKLRGPGDLQGTQQSGIVDLKIADIVKDEKLIQIARNKALELLKSDPNLVKKENSILAETLREMNKHNAKWSKIS